MSGENYKLPSKEIALEISSYCAGNCVMCPHQTFVHKNKNMEFSLFKKVVDEAVELGAISLDICLLGDALLDPGKIEKFEYVRVNYPHLKIYCSTTANSAEPEFVAKYLDSIQISLFAFTKETYNIVHQGNLDFDKTINNVNTLLALPEGKRPYIAMTFLLLPVNEHEMEAWKQKWEPLADEITIWKPHNWGGLYGEIKPQEDYADAKSCHRPFGGDLCVWINGDVSVCCFQWDKKLVVGNAYEKSLKEIAHSPEMARIQHIHKEGLFYGSGLPCEKCDQIFSRDDALIYSSKGRTVGTKVSHGDHVYTFKGNNNNE